MRKPMNPGLGQMILRIVIGVIFVAHGAATLFGDGGPGGLAGFLGSLGVPVPVLAAWLVTILEFVGGMFLIVGLFVLPTVLLLVVHMVMGIVLVHAQHGFYVVGPGHDGVEFNLLLIAGLLSILLGGPGLATVDGRSAPQAAPEPVAAPEPEPEPPPERSATAAGEWEEAGSDISEAGSPEAPGSEPGPEGEDERPVG